MGLEAATFIHQLNAANPVGASDPKGQGDDHLRMIKACLQATFPNIAGAVTPTHTQLNAVGASGVTGIANPTAQVGPTAVNGVATTVMRSDAAPAINLGASYSWTGAHSFAQDIVISSSTPQVILIDTDSTANNARWDMLADSDQFRLRLRADDNASGSNWCVVDRTGNDCDLIAFTADDMQLNGSSIPTLASAPTWTGVHTFTGLSGQIILQGTGPNLVFNEPAVTANNRRWEFFVDGEQFFGRLANDAANAFQNWLVVDRTNNVVDTVTIPQGTLAVTNAISGGTTISDAGGNVRDIPRLASGSAFTQGRMIAQNAGITINTSDLAAGRAFSIYNDSAAAITLTQGAGVTLRLAGTGTTGNRTIAARGICSLWCNSGTEVIASGNVT
jgi:hypothetical protein